ncbi:Endomembrane protein 70-domain-containing protein [Boletus edulis]|nr:Endomembrane protein 70-domain-containing protein [Boletus edulis]
MKECQGFLLGILLLLPVVSVSAFYLPGTAPRNFEQGEQVDLLVNALTPMLSGKDDSKLVRYSDNDYYNPAFHFCQPEGGPKSQPESLGSILFGDRIFNSPYDMKMLEENGTCRTLCTKQVPPQDAKFINDRIREDYAINWLVDGLPAAEMKKDLKTGDIFYDMGFNLGDDDTETPYLNNHYDIVLRYHERDPGIYRVVGVLVWPFSRGGPQEDTGRLDCDAQVQPLLLSETETTTVRYTYRVTWDATRWDNYLHIFDPRIHWFSIINSIVIVVFLCVMVAIILMRTVSRDNIQLARRCSGRLGVELVHGEVFRTPRLPMLLAVMVGNGAQLCAMCSVTLVFALLGFLSPSNRGSLATVMIVCWSFFGGQVTTLYYRFGGYYSSRVYASLGGVNRRKNAFVTATCCPRCRLVFIIIFLLNFFLIVAGSSGAVPFTTMLLIVLLWFGISAPLSAIGSYIGSRQGGVSHPVRVNQIPRQIPPKPRYLQPWVCRVTCAAFIELYFIMSSLFASRAYYAFGFLTLTAGVVALTTGTVAMLLFYPAGALWILLYGLFYWASRLSLDSFTSVALYLGYLFLLCLFDFLITGTIGFLASYWIVRRLYSAIRVD